MARFEHYPSFDMKEFERQLRREKLLNTREIEFTGKEFDFASSAKSRGGTFLFPKFGVVMSEPSEVSGFLYRAALDEDFKAAVMRHPLQSVETSGDVFGGGAWDLKHSQLMALLARGHFNSGNVVGVDAQNEQHILKTVAFLTLKGVTKAWELEHIYPFLSYSRFKPLQAKVYAEVEKSLPKNSRRLIKVLEGMTAAQREALYAFHLNNTEDLTRDQVARGLGISVDSLQDRINAAMKKIEAEFRELTPSKKNRPKYWAALFKLPDTRSQGVFKRSEALKVRPLFRIDPVTAIKTPIPVRTTRFRGTPIPGLRERKRWLRVTDYRPRHDGVESSKYAHMRNAYAHMAKSSLQDSGRTYVDFSSGDPKHVYEEHRRVNSEDQIRKKNDKIFPGLRKNSPSKKATPVHVSVVLGFDNLASLATHSK